MKAFVLLLVLLVALLACGNSEYVDRDDLEYRNGKTGPCRDEYFRVSVYDDKVRCGWPQAVGEFRVVGVERVFFCSCPRSQEKGDGGQR
jgi:hypothetical protein